MRIKPSRIIKMSGIFLFVLSIGLVGMATPGFSASGPPLMRMHGCIPQEAISHSMWIGRLPATTRISMAFTLPLRNQQELQELLTRLYDPADPLYGHYLTPAEFTEKFGPTQAAYDAVKNYALSMGFKITGTHPNRTILDVSGPAAAVEAAFGLHLEQYQAESGRYFYAPDNNPQVPGSIASVISGVIGLNNAAVWHTHNQHLSVAEYAKTSHSQIGTGPGGGLTPSNIKTAYNLTPSDIEAEGVTPVSGSGQTLGLFELDGYHSSDVAQYESYFNLRSVPLQNVLVDGASGRAGSGADEVTLDIELQVALAPGASEIMVYEGPNSNTGVVDTYDRIATDGAAKEISTSWGLSEGQTSSAVLEAENNIFMQMALQGQSIYAAAGDSGAYDNGSSLSVDDPASQPYMVGVGGTQLSVNGAGGTYASETTWNVNGTVSGGAGGGGISSVWGIPSYQVAVLHDSSPSSFPVSASMRNVPDVSLNADQYTGYSIYYKHNWYIYGGTSCAAPLWAAFTALVNQARGSSSPLGFANPAIYSIGDGSTGNYASDFHDIKTGNNIVGNDEGYYAELYYDNATGWGSFNGAYLLTDLADSTVDAHLVYLTATAGSGSVVLSWTTNFDATSYTVYRATTQPSPGVNLSSRLTNFTATAVKSTSSTTYTGTDSSVTSGTTYYYQVAETYLNSLNNPVTVYSNVVSATPGKSSGHTRGKSKKHQE